MQTSKRDAAPDDDRVRILDCDGNLRQGHELSLEVAEIERMHAAMLRARLFDERLLNLQRRGEVGTFAPVKGQEAAQIGSIACINEDDWFVPAFRETAASLWRGASMADLFVMTAGWNEGVNIPETAHDLPIAVPVASQLPHAVGIAYAEALRDSGNVVLTYFGDGATSEGDFHEALNFAGVYRTPVVFFCQNNGWAISIPRSRQTASETLSQKAQAYGLPGVQVDGNDLLAVEEATREAVKRAREDRCATMIEAVTYRMEVHTTADDPKKYRDEDEVEKWRTRDPIDRVQAFLEFRDQLDAAMIESLEKQIEAEIDTAWDEAKERIGELTKKPAETIFDHVFTEPTDEIRRQREELHTIGKS